MTESAFPFDSGPGSSIGAAEFRQLAQGAAFNVPGVVLGEANDLAAFGDSTPSSGHAGVIKLPSGSAFCFGTMYVNSAPLTLDVEENGGGSTRWDVLVIRFDWINKTATAIVIEGTSDTDGPALTSSRTTTFDLLIAYIKVVPSASTIASGDVFLCRDRWATQTTDVPLGSSQAYHLSEASVPDHYVLEAGQLEDRHYYPKLWFSDALPLVTDTDATWGKVTSGAIRFPDSRGRIPVTSNSMVGGGGPSGEMSPTIGAHGGEENHVLVEAELPSHVHAGGSLVATSPNSAHSHVPANDTYKFVVHKDGAADSPHSTTGADATNGLAYVTSTKSDGAHSHDVTGDSASTGGDDEHNNMQPYIVVNRIMKVA